MNDIVKHTDYYFHNLVRQAKLESFEKEIAWRNGNKTLIIYTGETVETDKGLIPDTREYYFNRPAKRFFDKLKIRNR